MRKSAHFRWIEEAEARRFRKFALQRAADEPHVTITSAELGSIWLVRLRSLLPRRSTAVFRLPANRV